MCRFEPSTFQWFREDIFSVAIHPAGLYIAAGFADKIRLLNILIDDMRLFHEFPVRECRQGYMQWRV